MVSTTMTATRTRMARITFRGGKNLRQEKENVTQEKGEFIEKKKRKLKNKKTLTAAR